MALFGSGLGGEMPPAVSVNYCQKIYFRKLASSSRRHKAAAVGQQTVGKSRVSTIPAEQEHDNNNNSSGNENKKNSSSSGHSWAAITGGLQTIARPAPMIWRPCQQRHSRANRFGNLLFVLSTAATLLFTLSLLLLLVETKANGSPQSEAAAAAAASPLFERRSLSAGGGSYGATYAPPGGRAQVAISLARVKNPDEESDELTSYDGGKSYVKKKKRKKFPITWLRNQYPFTSYYKRKKQPHEAAKSTPHQYPPADLSGQYSSQSYDVLDPNPATWVRIPNRPTASIKFHKQSQGPIEPADLEPLQRPGPFAMGPPLPPPMSLIPQAQAQLSAPELDSFPMLASQQQNMMMMNQPPHMMALARPPHQMAQAGAGGLMTSESQDSYSPQKAAAPAAAAAAAVAGGGGGGGGESGGFGGISLSFGNGRSISFGGGKGLTIGGKAGAIEIGRNAGGISIGSGNSDNQPAASGYSETKGGGGGGSSYGSSGGGGGGSYGNQATGGYSSSSSSSSSSGYGNDYVNKHPIMSVDVPRRGKKIVHANLDMAPIKFRLHSSPRVKITTGSRDPLEKPSDEELTEEEEDIFEPPAPFPKKNVTATNETDSMTNTTTTMGGNGTDSMGMNMTGNANGTEPMQLNQFSQMPYGNNNYYQQQQQAQQFNQHHFQQQQQHFSDYPHAAGQQHASAPAGNHFRQPQQHPYYDDNVRGVHIPVQANGNGGGNGGSYNNGPPHQHGQQQQQSHYQAQQFNQQVPFDEPPHFTQQPQQQQQQQQIDNVGGGTKQVQQHNFSANQQPRYQVFNANEMHAPPAAHPPSPAMMRPQVMDQQQPEMSTMPPIQQQMDNNNGLPPPAQMVVNQQQMNQPQQQTVGDEQRPAVNQWRQFSRETRPHLNQQAPKQAEPNLPDPNPHFYNGGHPNSIAGGQPVEARESKDGVDFAASSQMGAYAKSPLPVVQSGAPAPPRGFSQPIVSHKQFNPSTVYQVVPPAGGPQQPLAGAKGAQPSQPPAGPLHQHHQQQQQPAVKAPVQQANRQQQQPGNLQPESSYHAPQVSGGGGYHHQQQQHYQQKGGSYSNQQESGYKTYTFGNGGISTQYGSGDSGGYSNGAGGGASGGYGSSGYGSSGYGGHGGGGGGLVSSDGFDRKHYDAKVEKFDPDAHDKRERSKVVLFLRPRISIHMANSSTTTKRPKNQQRFINVINRPIFLNNITRSANNTNATNAHHDEEFIDPDLAEPMDVYASNYGYGYGHGYTKGYRLKTSTSTTKKPKRRTTTTTTTTSAPTTSSETESTTTTTTTTTGATSSGETEGTTTPASSTTTTTTTGDESSSTSSSTTESGGDSSSSEPTTTTTTTTTSAPSSSDSSGEVETASSSSPSSSSSSTTESDDETTEASTAASVGPADDSAGESGSDDLVASATEQAPLMTSVAPPPRPPPSTTTTTSTTTAKPTTTRPTTITTTTTTTTTPRPAVKSRATQRARTTTTTTTTSTTTTTTPEPPTTTTTTTEQPSSSSTTVSEEPATEAATEPPATTTSTTTTAAPPPPPSTTTTSTVAPEETASEGASSETMGDQSTTGSSSGDDDESSSSSSTSESAATTTTSTTEAPLSDDTTSDASFDREQQQQQQTKRSSRSSAAAVSSSATRPLAPRSLNQRVEPQLAASHQHQPMLLNEDLIEKLMRNKTLVGLMSSQLKRVIPSEQLADDEKQRIVRQVFVQMMEKKVDFSMNNVRLAVKTVSSSYRAAAEKSQKLTKPAAAAKSAGVDSIGANRKKETSKRRHVDPKGSFGRRAATTNSSIDDRSASTPVISRTAPVIDTALKLTGSGKARRQVSAGTAASRRSKSTSGIDTRTSAASSSSSSSDTGKQTDANGNPIVVVLLPTEKA